MGNNVCRRECAASSRSAHGNLGSCMGCIEADNFTHICFFFRDSLYSQPSTSLHHSPQNHNSHLTRPPRLPHSTDGSGPALHQHAITNITQKVMNSDEQENIHPHPPPPSNLSLNRQTMYLPFCVPAASASLSYAFSECTDANDARCR